MGDLNENNSVVNPTSPDMSNSGVGTAPDATPAPGTAGAIPIASGSPIPQPTAQPSSQAQAQDAEANNPSFSEHQGASIAKFGDNPKIAGALMSQPGGWSKMMIASTMDALGKAMAPVQPAVQPREDRASAAQAMVHRLFAPLAGGTGGLAGMGDAGKAAMEQDIAAKKQRTEDFQNQQKMTMEQQNQRMQMIQSNMQQLHTAQLMHTASDESLSKKVTDDTAFLNTLVGAGGDKTAIKSGLSEQESAAEIGKGWDPHTTFRLVTGKKQVDTAADGSAIYEPTYSIVHIPDTVNITDPAMVKRMYPEMSDEDLKKIDADHPYPVKGADAVALYQGAASRESATDALAAAKADAGMKDAAAKANMQASQNRLENLNFKAAHMFENTLADIRRDNGQKGVTMSKTQEMLTAVDHLERMAQGNPAYKDIAGDIKEAIGKETYDELLKHQIKEDGKKGDEEWQGQKKSYWLAHPESAGPLAASIMSKNAPNTSEYKEAEEMSHMAANAAEGSLLKKKNEAKSQEEGKNEEATSYLTPNTMNAIFNYSENPEHLFGLRGTQRAAAMDMIQKEAARRGLPEWSEAQYRERYATTQDFRPGGKIGAQITALNTFGKHAGMALEHVDGLYNTRFQLWNKGMNKVKENIGADAYAKMRTDLLAAKKEYISFLNAAHAETKEDQELANSLLDENSSPSKIKGVLAEMAQTVQARAESMNGQYKSTMGMDFPHMFDQRTASYLTKLGVDLTGTGGVIGSNPNQPVGQRPAQATPQQQPPAAPAASANMTHGMGLTPPSGSHVGPNETLMYDPITKRQYAVTNGSDVVDAKARNWTVVK